VSAPVPAGRVQDAFRRHAKALLRVGADGSNDAHVRPAGLAFELVPDVSPYDLRAGDVLGVRVLRGGAPVPGARVVGVSAASHDAGVDARTDDDGRAAVRLGAAGPWLLSSVDLTLPPDPSVTEWRSDWASLTFDLATAATRRADP